MSRIGRQPIAVPAQVSVVIHEQRVNVSGPKGKLSFDLPHLTRALVVDGRIEVHRSDDSSRSKALHGLARSILNNMVRGVSEGFIKKLEIQGVGYKAAVQGNSITMTLGYSHPIVYAIPESVRVVVEDNTKITIDGPDRQLVGQVAAELRSFYPPEPYKGKGVRYLGEKVIRKEGKTVQ